MYDRTKVILHCGGKAVTRDELDLIPLPEQTDSYMPVSHYGLVTKISTISQDILKGYTLSKESFGVARNGAQMFGTLQFQNGDVRMGLTIGIRNSYDKSMTVGFCAGASVFVCDNLAFSGEITFLRKHTPKVWDEIEERCVGVCYRAGKQYQEIVYDADKLIQFPFKNNDGFAVLGNLYGERIIGPRQFIAAAEEWRKPRHDEFQPRNAWSLYNAVTESLKTSPPQEVMEKHVNLHAYFKRLLP